MLTLFPKNGNPKYRIMENSIVILFHPKTQHENNYRYFHVPYSVLSLATMLDRSTFEIVIIDNNFQNIDDFSTFSKLFEDNILCVGISAMIGKQILDGLLFAKTIRSINSKIPIIWGGPITTFIPYEIIKNDYVDILVIGQGEIAFKEIVSALKNKSSLCEIKGIIYKENDMIFTNSKREFVSVDKFPNYKNVYDLIPVSEYIRFDEHINSKSISYHSSQGCVFNCGFCCEIPLWEKNWSGFSVYKIIEDIEYLVTTYGINGVKLYDSEFLIDKKRGFDFANELINKDIDIKWAASVHPNNLIKLTETEFKLLKRSGLSRLLIGAETAVENELKLIKKNLKKGSIVKLAEKCSNLDIHVCFTFITGYPNTTLKSIINTIEFAKQLIDIDSRHECKIHFYAPYPKTPLYEYAINNGFVPPKSLKEWADYDYYYITTPWVEEKYEKLVREFNENYYPYIAK